MAIASNTKPSLASGKATASTVNQLATPPAVATKPVVTFVNLAAATPAQITTWNATTASNNQLVSLLMGATQSQVNQLSAAQITALGNLVSNLSPAALAGLTGSAVAGITAAQIGALNPNQLAAIGHFDWLPAAAFAGLTAATIGVIRTGNPHALANWSWMSAAQIAALTPAAFAALTPAQIAQISNGNQGAGSGMGIQGITAAQIGALNPNQLAALTSAQKFLSSLPNVAIAGLTASQVTKQGKNGRLILNNLSSIQIQYLNIGLVSKLNAEQLSSKTADNAMVLNKLSTSQLSVLTKQTIQALDITGLTGQIIVTAGYNFVNSLSVAQVKDLSVPQAFLIFSSLQPLANIGTSFFESISMRTLLDALISIRGVSNFVLNELTSEQVNALFARSHSATDAMLADFKTLFDMLPPVTIKKLTADSVANLSPMLLASLSRESIEALNVSQLSGESIVKTGLNFINSLTKEQWNQLPLSALADVLPAFGLTLKDDASAALIVRMLKLDFGLLDEAKMSSKITKAPSKFSQGEQTVGITSTFTDGKEQVSSFIYVDGDGIIDEIVTKDLSGKLIGIEKYKRDYQGRLISFGHTNAIDPKDSQAYLASYDAKGNLLSESFYDAATGTATTIKNSYDIDPLHPTHSLLKTEEVLVSDGTKETVHTFTQYEYAKGSSMMTRVLTIDKLADSNSAAATLEDARYDAKGNLLSESFYDAATGATTTIKNSYNIDPLHPTHSLLNTEEILVSDGTKETVHTFTQYEYAKGSSMMTRVLTIDKLADSNSAAATLEDARYDADGNLLSESFYDAATGKTTTIKNIYEVNGVLRSSEKRIITSEGMVLSDLLSNYSPAGKILSVVDNNNGATTIFSARANENGVGGAINLEDIGENSSPAILSPRESEEFRRRLQEVNNSTALEVAKITAGVSQANAADQLRDLVTRVIVALGPSEFINSQFKISDGKIPAAISLSGQMEGFFLLGSTKLISAGAYYPSVYKNPSDWSSYGILVGTFALPSLISLPIVYCAQAQLSLIGKRAYLEQDSVVVMDLASIKKVQDQISASEYSIAILTARGARSRDSENIILSGLEDYEVHSNGGTGHLSIGNEAARSYLAEMHDSPMSPDRFKKERVASLRENTESLNVKTRLLIVFYHASITFGFISSMVSNQNSARKFNQTDPKIAAIFTERSNLNTGMIVSQGTKTAGIIIQSLNIASLNRLGAVFAATGDLGNAGIAFIFYYKNNIALYQLNSTTPWQRGIIATSITAQSVAAIAQVTSVLTRLYGLSRVPTIAMGVSTLASVLDVSSLGQYQSYSGLFGIDVSQRVVIILTTLAAYRYPGHTFTLMCLSYGINVPLSLWKDDVEIKAGGLLSSYNTKNRLLLEWFNSTQGVYSNWQLPLLSRQGDLTISSRALSDNLEEITLDLPKSVIGAVAIPTLTAQEIALTLGAAVSNINLPSYQSMFDANQSTLASMYEGQFPASSLYSLTTEGSIFYTAGVAGVSIQANSQLDNVANYSSLGVASETSASIVVSDLGNNGFTITKSFASAQLINQVIAGFTKNNDGTGLEVTSYAYEDVTQSNFTTQDQLTGFNSIAGTWGNDRFNIGTLNTTKSSNLKIDGAGGDDSYYFGGHGETCEIASDNIRSADRNNIYFSAEDGETDAPWDDLYFKKSGNALNIKQFNDLGKKISDVTIDDWFAVGPNLSVGHDDSYVINVSSADKTYSIDMGGVNQLVSLMAGIAVTSDVSVATELSGLYHLPGNDSFGLWTSA